MTASTFIEVPPVIGRRPGPYSALLRVVAVARDVVAPVSRTTATSFAVLTPIGRATALTAAVSWLVGWRLGWVELSIAATACAVVLLLAVLFVLGGSRLDGTLDVGSRRVVVGTPVDARLVVANRSKRRLLPVQVDLPVGVGSAIFDVPSLPAGEQHEELFVVPTHRRAVIDLGPLSFVQGDPVGMLRRERPATETIELFVHPVVTSLPPVGTGLLRDLEGQTTRDLSASDLAFHTLRDYVPGDDRRYIHWRSSAKAGKKLVRQFLETRRSRVTIAVDADRASYRDEDEFELTMSVVASLGVRCLRDDLDVTVVAGGHATTPTQPTRLLDMTSRAELGGAERGLGPATAKAADMATDTTFAILVTGSVIPFGQVRAAANRFGARVVPLAVRVEPDVPPGLSSSGGLTVLALRELSDLPRLVGRGSA